MYSHARGDPRSVFIRDGGVRRRTVSDERSNARARPTRGVSLARRSTVRRSPHLDHRVSSLVGGVVVLIFRRFEQRLRRFPASSWVWASSSGTSARRVASRSTPRSPSVGTSTRSGWSSKSSPHARGKPPPDEKFHRSSANADSRRTVQTGRSAESVADDGDTGVTVPRVATGPPRTRERPARSASDCAGQPRRQSLARESVAGRSARDGGGIWLSLAVGRSGRRHRSGSRLTWANSSGEFASAWAGFCPLSRTAARSSPNRQTRARIPRQ